MKILSLTKKPYLFLLLFLTVSLFTSNAFAQTNSRIISGTYKTSGGGLSLVKLNVRCASPGTMPIAIYFSSFTPMGTKYKNITNTRVACNIKQILTTTKPNGDKSTKIYYTGQKILRIYGEKGKFPLKNAKVLAAYNSQVIRLNKTQ